MYIRYAFFATLNLLFSAFAIIAAPVVALFVRQNGFLPRWLKWFGVPGVSLDTGLWDHLLPYTGTSQKIRRWWFHTNCLMCRPGEGFRYWPLGIYYNPDDWPVFKTTISFDGSLVEFGSVDRYEGHFSYMNSSGVELGWSAWWGISGSGWPMRRIPTLYGPDNRLAFRFRPW